MAIAQQSLFCFCVLFSSVSRLKGGVLSFIFLSRFVLTELSYVLRDGHCGAKFSKKGEVAEREFKGMDRP